MPSKRKGPSSGSDAHGGRGKRRHLKDDDSASASESSESSNSEGATLRRIPKMIGFSISEESQDAQYRAEAAKIEFLLARSDFKFKVVEDEELSGLVELEITVEDERGVPGAFQHKTIIRLFVATTISTQKLVDGRKSLSSLGRLHYHVCLSAIDDQHPCKLYRRKWDSKKAIGIPHRLDVKEDHWQFIVVGFDPQKWSIIDGSADTVAARRALQERRKQFPKDKNDSEVWAQTYYPRRTVAFGEKDVVRAQRFIGVRNFEEEITVLNVGELTSDKLNLLLHDPIASKSCEVIASKKSYARIFVLKSNPQIVYINMPDEDKHGEDLPVGYTVVDSALWSYRKLKIESKEYNEFLDGYPCKEGLHCCKKGKLEQGK